jgi:hypothetical protein
MVGFQQKRIRLKYPSSLLSRCSLPLRRTALPFFSGSSAVDVIYHLKVKTRAERISGAPENDHRYIIIVFGAITPPYDIFHHLNGYRVSFFRSIQRDIGQSSLFFIDNEIRFHFHGLFLVRHFSLPNRSYGLLLSTLLLAITLRQNELNMQDYLLSVFFVFCESIQSCNLV